MKATKILLAASIFAVAGAANAAIVDTYTVTVAGVTSGLASGSLSGSGTATFDVSGTNGTLTVDYTALNNQPAAGGTFNTVVHVVYTGTISGNSFTNTGGTLTITGCSAGSIACPAQTPVGVADPLEPTGSGSGTVGGRLEQVFAINGGGQNTTNIKQYSNLLTNKVTYTFSAATPVSSVPVPAAAWLFGSGLVGLASTARRRRSV